MDEFFKNKSELDLKKLDEILIAELEGKILKPASFAPVIMDEKEYYFRNSNIARIFKDSQNLKKLKDLEAYILDQGGFEFSSISKAWEDTDGEKGEVTVLRASLIKRFPMGTHYWLRDNAIAAFNLLNADLRDVEFTRSLNSLGRKLLISSLRIASSASQLDRFKNIIKHPVSKPIDKKLSWPYIFMAIEDNLNSSKTEGWQHIQDAWQMLICFIFRELIKKTFTSSDLSPKMKIFLGIAPLFLKRVDVCNYESAGSWEEVASKRSSVLVWEYELLSLYKELDTDLVKECEELTVKFLTLKEYNLLKLAEELKAKVEDELVVRLPYESPQYPKTSVRYREADAALMYVLQTKTLERLADNRKISLDQKESLKKEILELFESLRDPATNLIRRYHGDVYQVSGFFRLHSIYKLTEFFGGASTEVSEEKSFIDRQNVLPPGREAAWVHPVWQMSAWNAKQYAEIGDKKYLATAKNNFALALTAFTGASESALIQQENGEVRVEPLKACLIPECYISDKNKEGLDLIFPTPHTPLHWAIGEAIAAFTAMYQLM